MGIPHQWRYSLARDLGALLALQVRRRVMGAKEGSVSDPPPMVDPVFGAVLVLRNVRKRLREAALAHAQHGNRAPAPLRAGLTDNGATW